MTPGRRRRRVVAAPVVTVRRISARPARALLVTLGVALAVAFVVDVVGGSVVSEDLALRRAVGALPPGDRVERVSWSGQVASGGFAALDRRARGTLRLLTGEPISASVALADVDLGRATVKLAATDSPGGAVRLASGRLPATCGLSRCEVVQLGGRRLDRLDGFGVHLVVVGRGTLASQVPFGEGGLAASPARQEPVLLTRGVAALAGLAPLVEINRNYSWSAPLAPGSVQVWNVGPFFRTEGRAEANLAASDPEFALTGPDDALAASRSESVTASHRILLVGGSATLLLLGFLGITAGGLRRDTRAELRRLERRGATQGQQWSFVAAESAVAVVPGALAGLAIGAAVDALLADRAGVPVGAALAHGVLTSTAIVMVAGAAAAALLVVLVALRRPDSPTRPGVQAADMAAVGALVALAALVASGTHGNGGFGRGPAVALAATPILAGFAFAVLLARALEPALRTALRRASGAPTAVLLALLTLYRAPRRTAAIVAFFAVSTGLAAFALAYRSTLATSGAQTAAYQVPLDFTLEAGPALSSPQDVAPLRRYRSLAPGVGAWPVLRQTAEVAGSGTTPATPDVVGVPAAAFPLLHGWRGDFARASPSALGALLRPTRPTRLAGATIPARATRLELRGSSTGTDVQLVLVVATPSGGADELRPQPATARPQLLSVPVPAADRGGRVIAVQLELPSAVQRSEAHQAAEGTGISNGFGGVLELGPLTAVAGGRRVPVTSFAGWLGHHGVTASPAGGGRRLRFVITTAEQAMLRPRQPFDGRPLPVVASPDAAAAAGPDGSLDLNFGDQIVHARLVAVARRFPTTQDNDGSFVIADEASLAAALGAEDLPSSIPGELWLSAPPATSARVAAALRSPPFSSLSVSSRTAIAAALRNAPLARGITLSLLAAAAVALCLALVGLALATEGFVRDDADTLLDLESQGVGPRELRSSLRLRALALAALGLPAGLVLGYGLVALVGRLLALDATLAVPNPPLERVVPWVALGVFACAFALLATALVEVVLRIAHRAGVAGRGSTGETWAS